MVKDYHNLTDQNVLSCEEMVDAWLDVILSVIPLGSQWETWKCKMLLHILVTFIWKSKQT